MIRYRFAHSDIEHTSSLIEFLTPQRTPTTETGAHHDARPTFESNYVKLTLLPTLLRLSARSRVLIQPSSVSSVPSMSSRTFAPSGQRGPSPSAQGQHRHHDRGKHEEPRDDDVCGHNLFHLVIGSGSLKIKRT